MTPVGQPSRRGEFNANTASKRAWRVSVENTAMSNHEWPRGDRNGAGRFEAFEGRLRRMHMPGEKPNEQLNTDQRTGVNHAPGRWCAFDPKACCNNLLQRHRPGNRENRAVLDDQRPSSRSEERRVGKEC